MHFQMSVRGKEYSFAVPVYIVAQQLFLCATPSSSVVATYMYYM